MASDPEDGNTSERNEDNLETTNGRRNSVVWMGCIALVVVVATITTTLLLTLGGNGNETEVLSSNSIADLSDQVPSSGPTFSSNPTPNGVGSSAPTSGLTKVDDAVEGIKIQVGADTYIVKNGNGVNDVFGSENILLVQKGSTSDSTTQSETIAFLEFELSQMSTLVPGSTTDGVYLILEHVPNLFGRNSVEYAISSLGNTQVDVENLSGSQFNSITPIATTTFSVASDDSKIEVDISNLVVQDWTDSTKKRDATNTLLLMIEGTGDGSVVEGDKFYSRESDFPPQMKIYVAKDKATEYPKDFPSSFPSETQTQSPSMSDESNTPTTSPSQYPSHTASSHPSLTNSHSPSTSPSKSKAFIPTVSPEIQSQPTPFPSTFVPTTLVPTTAIPTTSTPDTFIPTVSPEIQSQPTPFPSTFVPTTLVPTTIIPTTTSPTVRPTKRTSTALPSWTINDESIILPDQDTFIYGAGSSSRFETQGKKESLLVQKGSVDGSKSADAWILMNFDFACCPNIFSQQTDASTTTQILLELEHISKVVSFDSATYTVVRLDPTPLSIEELHGGMINLQSGIDGPSFNVKPSDTNVSIDITSLVVAELPLKSNQLLLQIENRGPSQPDGGDRFYSRETDFPPQIRAIVSESSQKTWVPTSTTPSSTIRPSLQATASPSWPFQFPTPFFPPSTQNPIQDPFNGSGEFNRWDNGGTTGLELTFINALDEKWVSTFLNVLDEWNSGDPDVLTLSHERVTPEYDCDEVTGKVKACSGDYGETSWRGLNTLILDGDGIVVSSSVRMNEYYLQNATDSEKQYTMCHEIGHSFGLPHTDECFYNADLGDCLDYTNNPEANKHPGQINFDRLEFLYGDVGSRKYERVMSESQSVAEVPNAILQLSRKAVVETFVRKVSNENDYDWKSLSNSNGGSETFELVLDDDFRTIVNLLPPL